MFNLFKNFYKGKIDNTDSLDKVVDNKKSITVIIGDITKYSGDCIVNAANTSMLGGGGVDGAIHKVAGEELDKWLYSYMEKRNFIPYKTAEPLLTKGYNLPAKNVIHVAGPIFNTSKSLDLCKEQLKAAYINTLDMAIANNFTDIAFPSISTGIYAFPLEEAAKIVKDVFEKYADKINISMICFDENTFFAYDNMFNC